MLIFKSNHLMQCLEEKHLLKLSPERTVVTLRRKEDEGSEESNELIAAVKKKYPNFDLPD